MQESRPGVLAAGSSQRGRRSLETTLSGADPQLVAMHDEVIERYLGSHDRADTVARAKVQILDQFPSGRRVGAVRGQCAAHDHADPAHEAP